MKNVEKVLKFGNQFCTNSSGCIELAFFSKKCFVKTFLTSFLANNAMNKVGLGSSGNRMKSDLFFDPKQIHGALCTLRPLTSTGTDYSCLLLLHFSQEAHYLFFRICNGWQLFSRDSLVVFNLQNLTCFVLIHLSLCNTTEVDQLKCPQLLWSHIRQGISVSGP